MLTWLRPRRRGPPPFHLPAIERARSAAAVPLQASWPPRPTDISFNSRHVLQQATRSHKHLTLKLISRCMSLSRALQASVGDEHFARELIEQSAGHPCGAHVDQGCTEGVLQPSCTEFFFRTEPAKSVRPETRARRTPPTRRSLVGRDRAAPFFPRSNLACTLRDRRESSSPPFGRGAPPAVGSPASARLRAPPAPSDHA